MDSGSDTLINLASNEYFKAVNKNKLNARIIVPEFKEFKDSTYKFMSFYGKKARGMMARYIIQNRINEAEKIKHFDMDGYFYNDLLSEDLRWVFTRG